MIYAYTGLPGGGKSLSAIADFLLPQLRKERHLFCNIVGLNPMLIAAKLGTITSEINRYLHRFSMSFNDEVAANKMCYREELEDGSVHYANAKGLSMLVADVMQCKEAVFIIDECHEYLSAENFRYLGEFRKYLSMSRHHGHDVVLITQHITDIWEPFRNRIHETHNFTRGLLGLKTHYKENVYYGWNVFAEPGFTKQRRNDKTIYPLYSSHDGGAKEHMNYISIWKNNKFRFYMFFVFAIFIFVFFQIRKSVSYITQTTQPVSVPAPEFSANSNVIYVKYVVCGTHDCKATRPDGSVLTLPLDYASGKYPIEVKKYVSNPSAFGGAPNNGNRPGVQNAPR